MNKHATYVRIGAAVLVLLLAGLLIWRMLGRPGRTKDRPAPDFDRAFTLAVANDIRDGTATLNGTLRKGQTLTFSLEGESAARAAEAESLQYTWQRCREAGDSEEPQWEDIPDANTVEYTLTDEDYGYWIRAVISGVGDFSGTLYAETAEAVQKQAYTGEEPVQSTCASPTDLTITASIEPNQEYIVAPYTGEEQPSADKWEDAYQNAVDEWHRFKGLRASTEYAVWTRFPETSEMCASMAVATRFRTEALDCPFTDVQETDWFSEAVTYVYGNALMSGVSEESFDPEGVMRRNAVVTVLWHLEGEPESDPASFPDVAAEAWYSEAVAWALETEIISGYDDGMFKPAAAVTREQLAVIFCRYAVYKGHTIQPDVDLSAYTDWTGVQAYAQDAMRWCVQREVLTGVNDTELQPGGNVTRAQFAAALMQFTGQF